MRREGPAGNDREAQGGGRAHLDRAGNGEELASALAAREKRFAIPRRPLADAIADLDKARVNPLPNGAKPQLRDHPSPLPGKSDPGSRFPSRGRSIWRRAQGRAASAVLHEPTKTRSRRSAGEFQRASSGGRLTAGGTLRANASGQRVRLRSSTNCETADSTARVLYLSKGLDADGRSQLEKKLLQSMRRCGLRSRTRGASVRHRSLAVGMGV